MMYRWEMEPPINPNNIGGGNGSSDGDCDNISLIGGVAPFVLKTYHMVSDPATNHLISWGRANNSFVVIDPLLFSRLVLPFHFKHSNFSSFIRQLNTYGFRKVDPDRYEFANEWFLRGQKHLLKRMSRRKHNPGQISDHSHRSEGGEAAEETVEREIEKMREEQEEMEKEIQGMTRRLETTERRPDQMMEFLCKVVEDPEILPKMVVERERRTRRQKQICSIGEGSEKKRRLFMTSSPSSVGATTTVTASNSGKTEEEEESSSLGVASSSTSEVEPVYRSPINDAWFGGGESGEFVGLEANAPAEGEVNAPAYPFSLLGGDF